MRPSHTIGPAGRRSVQLDRIESFNVLYVALTRAKQVLVVSGVELIKSAGSRMRPISLVADALKALGDSGFQADAP